MPNCFVIMPISTPEHLWPIYGSDRDHFEHVLNHLIRPAVSSAGLELIPPTMSGADLIHAELVRNLEQCDLVLCDMSTLNPNVFFELGIRTALNKPVCLVKDDVAASLPFDTGIINYHTYRSLLAPWTLDTDINLLSAHIKASVDRSAGSNALWRYFGLALTAIPSLPADPKDARLDYLTLQIESLVKKVDDTTTLPQSSQKETSRHDRYLDVARTILRRNDNSFKSMTSYTDGRVKLITVKPVSQEMAQELADVATNIGLKLDLQDQ